MLRRLHPLSSVDEKAYGLGRRWEVIFSHKSNLLLNKTWKIGNCLWEALSGLDGYD